MILRTKGIQGGIPWRIPFVDHIVLIDKSWDGVYNKLEYWRHTLELRGFKLSMPKTECIRCGFSGSEEGHAKEITTSGVAMSRVEKFRYLAQSFKRQGTLIKH